MALFLALISADVEIPMSRSLKEKRAVIRPIKDRIRSRFNVSVIENDYQDDRQRGSVLVAGLADGRRNADSVASSVINFIESNFGHLDIAINESVVPLERTYEGR